MRYLTCTHDELNREILIIFSHHGIFLCEDIVNNVIDSYKDVPFHNIRHAFEVMEMCSFLIDNMKLQLPIFNVFLLLFCSLCHDIGHQGIPNREQHVCTYVHDDVHRIVSNCSNNEQVHIETTLKNISDNMHLMPEYIRNKSLHDLNSMIKAYVLGTDLALYESYMHVHDESILLRLADFSHFFKPAYIHLYWTSRVYQEMKSEINFEVQQKFIDDIVEPLLFISKSLFNEETFDHLQSCLEANMKVWV